MPPVTNDLAKDDFRGYEHEFILAATNKKRLTCTANPFGNELSYSVFHNHNNVGDFRTLSEAIKKYNSI